MKEEERGVVTRILKPFLLVAVSALSIGACSPRGRGVEPVDVSESTTIAYQQPVLSDGNEWREKLRRVDTLTVDNADGAWHLIALNMAPQAVNIFQGGAQIAVLGDIPAGAHLSVDGGGACVVIGGIVEQGATVTGSGNGTIILSVRNATPVPGVTVSGGYASVERGRARILTRTINPERPFDGCDVYGPPHVVQ